jgi:hypothetical protein
MRGVSEALGLDPTDGEALALRAQIDAGRGAAPGSGPGGPGTGSGPRVVGPPPPASARQLTGAQARPPSGARPAAGAPPPLSAPPPELPLQPPALTPAYAASDTGVPIKRSSKLPLAFLGLATVVAILCGFAALLIWRQISPRLFPGPKTAQEGSATPGPTETPVTPEPRPADASTESATPVGPTTPHSEDAALTARLARAVGEFQAQRTASALNTLAGLIDEAPQRDDLRQTADQWARTLQARAGEVRATARKPAQLPPVMRMADGYVLRGEAELGAGDPIAAARAFERGRDAWAAIVSRQVSRGITEAPSTAEAEPPVEPARAATREPAPREPAAREPAPREPEPSAREVQALTPEQEFERANIMRLLQSFKRAFDSRSGESLRPIWPTLSAGAAQGYHGQWQRALSQQWTYNSVHIRMGADGRRASVETEVTVTSLSPGARENSVDRRRVTFSLERLGPLWVLAGVNGI